MTGAAAQSHFAAEAFRFMTEHGIAPSPENYRLFYAHFSGGNAELSQAVSEIERSTQPFSAETMDGLRARFDASNQTEAAIADLGIGVSGALRGVLSRLAVAERDTAAYGRTLSLASSELDRPAADARRLLSTLLAATHTMEARTRDLEAELQRASAEVDALKAKLDDVRKESLTDALTGIANRKAFDAELRNAIACALHSREPLCLLMCDVDRFKMFNDTWGHQTGDQVLRLVANCLSENVKGRDTAARFGGEEFAVVLPQTTLADAVALANSIRRRVEGKKLVKKSTGDILGAITISIGVSHLSPSDTAESLIQRADACLYAAKRGGRNLVVAQTDVPASRAA